MGDEPTPVAPPVVPNTIPDPVRKGVAIALAASGLAILLLGIVTSMFPMMQANPAPALQWGPMLLGSAGFTIWDRQVPVL